MVTFTTKRAHLGGVAFGKRVVRKVEGMTPARFDLLYVIRKAHGRSVTQFFGYFLRQDKLTRSLGLHPSTVSKMIRRLVEMGWIEKERRPVEDARTNIVRLTKRGARRIDRAMRIVLGGRTHRTHFEVLFGKMNPKSCPPALVGAFYEDVDMVARAFGDQSCVFYDFGFSDH